MIKISKRVWCEIALTVFAVAQLAGFGKTIFANTPPAAAIQQQQTSVSSEQPAAVNAIRRQFNPRSLERERLIKNEIARSRVEQLKMQERQEELKRDAAERHDQYADRTAHSRAVLQEILNNR